MSATQLEGFYVTMQRGSRTAWLLGPFTTKPEAELHVPAGRRLAHDVDAFTAFDLFGVSRALMKPGAALPAGVLNARFAAEAPADPFAGIPQLAEPF